MQNDMDVKEFFERDKSIILPSQDKDCNIREVLRITERWKNEGYRLVFTAGVFDIFHINHLLGLYNYKLMGGEKSKLIVSVDTDARVHENKSRIREKGGGEKPILSWKSRSLMLAKQCFNGRRLVDLVIQHGADTCGGRRCPHDDNVDLAKIIDPDIIVVTYTSKETISRIRSDAKLCKKMRIIHEDELAYFDELLDENISDSAIIQRARR